jgi:CheY-like chemotaxis protein
MSKKLKILIVEDEAIPALHLQTIFSTLGYTVLEPVPTGEEAVEIAEREELDVILMDIRLEGKLDGVQAAKKILQFRDVTIIFMTGYDQEDVMSQIEGMDHAGYFMKPLNIERIKRIVENVANKKEK